MDTDKLHDRIVLTYNLIIFVAGLISCSASRKLQGLLMLQMHPNFTHILN